MEFVFCHLIVLRGRNNSVKVQAYIEKTLDIEGILLCDPAAALANGSASNLEVSNNIMTIIILIMPIFAVRINLFVVKVYNVCIVIILATVLLA